MQGFSALTCTLGLVIISFASDTYAWTRRFFLAC